MDPDVEAIQTDESNVETVDNNVIETDSSASGSSESEGNPAWNELLSAVPQEFHPHLQKGFGDWDKGVQQRFQKVQQQYAPYKELAELKVDPTEINEAMQFRHLLQTQPEEVFKWMQEQYKFGQPVSQGQQENKEETLELDENEAFFNDPRYKEVASKAAFAEQAIQTFNQQAVEAKANEQLQTEVSKVQEQFPGLDITAVATYALGLSQQNGKSPNLIEAATAMSGFVPNAAPEAPRASDSAPPIIAGNRGALPSNPSPKLGAMSSDERSKYVAELMAAALDKE